MEWLQQLLDSSTIPLVTAFLLGLLTAISPCPLATNITAIGFISKDIESRHRIFWNGILYTVGRIITYAGIGFILIPILREGASVYAIQKTIGKYGEMAIAPALILIGLFMLFGNKLNIGKFGFSGGGEKLGGRGRAWEVLSPYANFSKMDESNYCPALYCSGGLLCNNIMAIKVLILCTGNSCRSQMTHGFLQSFDEKLIVRSAGTRAAGKLNEGAVEAMAEVGIDISSHTSDPVETYLGEEWDYVITVCGGANESCPMFTGAVKHRLHFGFDDPSHATGTPEFIKSEFCRVRNEIHQKFHKFYTDELMEEPSCPCGVNYFCKCE